MASQGVPKEAEAEGDGILKIGDMQLQGRLVSDASEEIMLLWAIGQPCTARQNNFVKQTSNHLKLDACGHNLCIQQSPSSMNTSGVTGGVMWDSGVVLGKFLEHAVDSDLLNLRGKKCVELGSGCGLVGCIAALLGGNVVLTDMPDRLRLLAKNVEENARELDARGSASVRELTWGEDLDSDLLNPLPDYGLGYEAGNGKMNKSSSESNIVQCSHCKRKGHSKERCWDLNPCTICGLKNHCNKTCWNKEVAGCIKMDCGWNYGSKWQRIVAMIKGLFKYKCSNVRRHTTALGNKLGHGIEEKTRFSAWHQRRKSFRHGIE